MESRRDEYLLFHREVSQEGIVALVTNTFQAELLILFNDMALTFHIYHRIKNNR